MPQGDEAWAGGSSLQWEGLTRRGSGKNIWGNAPSQTEVPGAAKWRVPKAGELMAYGEGCLTPIQN